MQYLVEEGATHREVLEKVRARYGDAAQVLSHRTVRTGGFLGLFAREGVEITFYLKDESVRETERKRQDMEDEKRKLLDRINQEKAIQEVLSEVRSIKNMVEDGAGRASGYDDEHPTLAALDELLVQNDFSPSYRQELLARARSEFSLDGLEDYKAVEDALLSWVGDRIQLPGDTRAVRPRVIVLVGPTGVGKTTTIAKLAAIHNLGMAGEQAQDVRMITIDNFRIGARQQIETYGSPQSP